MLRKRFSNSLNKYVVTKRGNRVSTENVFINKIDEIKNALNSELYNCALALSLTIPDICGKVEYPKEKNKSRYTKWFHEYAEKHFITLATKLPEEKIVEYQWLTADECYALRCSVLHAGDYNVEGINLEQIHIHAHKRNGENYSHTIRDSRFIDIDVINLCEKLCQAAEEYYNSVGDTSRFDLDEVRIDAW